MEFVTDYARVDEVGQYWTSDLAGIGGVSTLVEKRLGMRKFEQIPFVLGQWIEAKAYYEPGVTIKTLAKQLGINSNYLSNYFNHTLGLTFQEWLHNLRIDEAKRIIAEDPSMRMSAVASSVGIPLPYNFSRWFKIVTGMTANNWRSICRASKAEKF